MTKKKKIIIISAVIAVIAISSVITGILLFRKNKDPKFNPRDIYAFAAASSIGYLSESGGASSASYGELETLVASPVVAVERPSTLSNNDVTGVYNCLSMFDSLVTGGGYSQSIKSNTSTNNLLKDYTFEMAISLPTGSGTYVLCTMYFDEINTKTNKEIDDGKEEIETNTKFEGVIVYGEETFIVEGETEVEVEGRETEYSIEFITYKNTSLTGLVADRNNYVVVEQSIEDDEIEYEYTIYSGGRKVQDIELEFEQERNGIEIEFQLKDLSSGKLNQTVFVIRKGSTSDFAVSFNKNGNIDTISVNKAANDSYTFTYSNEFVETLPLV